MVDFSKISAEVCELIKEVALLLRGLGIGTITPEAVVWGLWNWDCDRPEGVDPLFWSPDRQDFVMKVAGDIMASQSDAEVNETDFSADMIRGFEAILSANEAVTLENLTEWLVGRWLPTHYPNYFTVPAPTTQPSGPSRVGNTTATNVDTTPEPPFVPIRKPADDDAKTGATIKEYCDNMLALAINGKLHRAIGREKEMEDLLLYLAMNTKNCPALIGKPGTGKTAIAEELAFRLAAGNIPEPLRQLKLYRLDYSRIRASGKEEEIMRNIIDQAADDPELVLFIDEMHLLIHNHPQAPNLVAQMLKPPMARGEIKIIGATTYEEYQQNIESDQAFERRFNPITIKEPDVETTKTILRRSEARFNHGLTLSDEALYEAIALTSKYVKNRHLPAKAIELIDQAAARLSLQGSGVCELTPDDLKRELAAKTGLPLERVSQDETIFLNSLEEKMHEIVVGQDLAVSSVADAIRLRRAGGGNDDRPIGSFLFLGTTGTGKTLLSKAVAQVLFGDKKKMVRLNMSEYCQENDTTKLIGPPPGYVGYENGGTLTNAVLQNPYTVVLVDELEKAHPAVHNLFLQVLDEGHLTDNHGRTVDFSNTVVIMTSNICQKEILQMLPQEGVTQEDVNECVDMVMRQLSNHLPLELINRFNKIVMFEPILFSNAVMIAELLLEEKEEQLKAKQNISLRHEADVVEFIAHKGYSRELGARNINRAVEEYVENPLTQIKFRNLLNVNLPIVAYVGNDKVEFRNE